MKHSLLILMFLAAAFFFRLAAAAPPPFDPSRALESCNVTWTTPGASSADSMPLGNGDIGLNVWTEASGDVLFYISKSDAWTEEAKSLYGLAKLGRVRVSLSPNPFGGGGPLLQTLLLASGEIQIQGGSGSNAARLRIWVDANHPVIRVEVSSARPIDVRVTLDPWRTQPVGKVSADVVMPVENNRIVWYHRNDAKGEKQTANWTFGAGIQGDNFLAGQGATLHSAAPLTVHCISIYPLTMQTGTVEDWKSRLAGQIGEVGAIPLETARGAHQQWWREFWRRSWIFVGGGAKADEVTRGYAWQRFITACAGRGAYPIKFNGSLFTMDDPAHSFGRDKATGVERIEPVTADYRSWGGQYWFQNTRPMYWARLKAGDFDLMLPLFRMYGQVLQNNAPLIKSYYGHDGSYMAETAPFWGGVGKLNPASPGGYTEDYFTPVLELSAMMLDYYDYTGDGKFLRETLLPATSAGITFFDQHWKRDDKGKLLLDPDNSIEMFWKVRNPLPDIAGLHDVLGRLLDLPAGAMDPAKRAQWQRLVKELPDVPTGTRGGKKMLLPCEDGQNPPPHNSENPELYAVHPFRLYGTGKPDLEMARDTFAARANKRSYCWHQDGVEAALLGLTDQAQKGVTEHFTRYDKRLRFKAFWEKGHDYEPDQDNGGNGELALQAMLLQADGKKILLLPAWPKNWTADFKLHAPLNTTVEGHVEDGKISNLKVTPENRRADIVLTES